MMPPRQPRPMPRPPLPPQRPEVKSWVTCHRCNTIVEECEWLSALLDGKPICCDCLHKARFGALEAECAERGFHVTDGHSSCSWKDDHELRCKCSRVALWKPAHEDDQFPDKWTNEGSYRRVVPYRELKKAAKKAR